MNRSAIVVGLLLAMGALLLGRFGGLVQGQGAVLMAIDANPLASGIQPCIGGVTVGSSIPVDLVIDGAPDVEGFGLRLLYDNAMVSITSKDRSVSILGPSGFDVGEPLPDSDGSYLDGYAGNATSGTGILMRYILRAEAAGTATLDIVVGNVDTNYVDSALITHLPDQSQDALVGVGAPCPAPTSPTPSPTFRATGTVPPGLSPTLTPTPRAADQGHAPTPTVTPTPLPGPREPVSLVTGCNLRAFLPYYPAGVDLGAVTVDIDRGNPRVWVQRSMVDFDLFDPRSAERSTVTTLIQEAGFICVDEAAVWNRPALA